MTTYHPPDVSDVPALGEGINTQALEAVDLTDRTLVASADITFDQWAEVGQWLKSVGNGLQWWLGDWLNIGEDKFGEEYSQALDATGLKLGTLQQYAWVARRVPPDRRIAGLSFSHYREIADLDPESQLEWLRKAVDGDEGEPWSSERLRKELKAAKNPERVGYWVLISCKDAKDQEEILERFKAEGRQAKAVDR